MDREQLEFLFTNAIFHLKNLVEVPEDMCCRFGGINSTEVYDIANKVMKRTHMCSYCEATSDNLSIDEAGRYPELPVHEEDCPIGQAELFLKSTEFAMKEGK